MAAPAFRALPPGVYFNPTAEECVRDYLKPWAAGEPPETDRVICDVDVYSDSPGALLLGREPGFSRGSDHKWLLLSRCACGGAGRGKREVATGGSWQSEQTPRGVVGGAADGEGGEQEPRRGRRRSFGFYVGENGRKRGGKTPWLMEEFTALDLEDGDGHGGGGGDGTFPVFCRIYLSPRLEKEDREKKRQILGDDMVAFDRRGKPKPVRVVVSPELFDAATQGQVLAPPPPRLPPPPVLGFQQAQPARRVLGHQQGQPPPPAPRVLGYQQVQPAAPPPLRFLGHQHGQAAAAPAVLGDCHGCAMLPWGVPAHHHGHAAAAPHQGFLGSRQGQAAVQPHPCYNQEASPRVRLLDPRQSEVMKKPRLAYGSPAASQPRSSDSCVVHISPSQEQGVVVQIHDGNQCSAEPVATTPPPPQEIPATATAGSAEAEPPCYASAPAAPAELADDAWKAEAEPMADLGLYVNLMDFEPFSDGMPDFLTHGEFKSPFDDDPPPPPGFDEFLLVDLTAGSA